MPKIAYIEKNFAKKTLKTIYAAIDIIEEYREQGFSLTLRQLYYQFVARDLIPNRQKEYNRLGTIINDARLAGYIDWKSIVDRTRSLESVGHWKNPAEIIQGAASGYRIDRWKHQPSHVEVWIEKDALVGVIERVCNELDVPYFSCRGYVSQSEMWSAARRLGASHYLEDKHPVILHLGDHDPSGIDMTRDIQKRLNELATPPEERQYVADWESIIKVNRIALNAVQIKELNPPPNPAKVTDSRFEGYLAKYGSQSWELDALEPRYLSDLIEQTVWKYIDTVQWEEDVKRENQDRAGLEKISEHYSKVKTYVDNL